MDAEDDNRRTCEPQYANDERRVDAVQAEPTRQAGGQGKRAADEKERGAPRPYLRSASQDSLILRVQVRDRVAKYVDDRCVQGDDDQSDRQPDVCEPPGLSRLTATKQVAHRVRKSRGEAKRQHKEHRLQAVESGVHGERTNAECADSECDDLPEEPLGQTAQCSKRDSDHLPPSFAVPPQSRPIRAGRPGPLLKRRPHGHDSEQRTQHEAVCADERGWGARYSVSVDDQLLPDAVARDAQQSSDKRRPLHILRVQEFAKAFKESKRQQTQEQRAHVACSGTGNLGWLAE
eukprot:7341679-Prymnesium_polylepis.1